MTETKTPAPVHASQLIDPEDMRINAAINMRGYTSRVATSRSKTLMKENWLTQLEEQYGEIILKSLDVRYSTEGVKSYYGTVVVDMVPTTSGEPSIGVFFISTGETVFFHFWSASMETSDAWCDWVRENLFIDKVPDVFDAKTNSRDLSFWGQKGADYVSFKRKVVLLDWEDSVEKNYPKKVREELEQLRNLEAPILGGKIILLHGPPGTGKTSLLRTLSKHWTKWVHSSYITDPENFLGHAGSMLQVITWDYSSFISAGVLAKDAYHMVIIEDADSLIRQDAQERSGQAMSRLLNLGDGLLGQSTNLLIVITTNVDIQNLNAAVSREGRCLAKIHFDKFPYVEACEWITNQGKDLDPTTILKQGMDYTLAELYQLIAEKKQIVATKAEYARPGTYL